MKKFPLIIAIILILLSISASLAQANNFSHIRTVGFDYWNLSGDPTQSRWLAQRHDFIVGGTFDYDTVKSANPDVKLIPYIAYNTYEKTIQDWIKNWCQQNGYNFEDTFYHYYYDTEVNLRSTNNPDKVLVKGYGGGSATTIEESRVPSAWASYAFGIDASTGQITRSNINPTSIAWRRGYEAYIFEKLITVNAAEGKYNDGIFLDTFDGTVSSSNDLYLENTVEMRNLGLTTNAAVKARVSDDLVASMKELKSSLSTKLGRSVPVSPNAADVDTFYYWAKNIYADRIADYEYVTIEYMVRAGSNTLRIQRLKQAYDSMVNDGIIFFSRNETSIMGVSEKVKQFLIAGHYLINHPNYILMYHEGGASFYGGSPGGQLYNTHWHKNLEYNIGSPVVRSGSDYWGTANTDRFFTFAKGTNYEIVGREYTNVLVLAKFGSQGGVANAGLNPTTHSLNSTYRLLQPDNALGSPITEITLGQSEGAILIKEGGTLDTTPPAAPSGVTVQ